MSPGYDLWPSVSSVVPVFTLARTNASIEAAELSGIAARRMRPDRVSQIFRSFPPYLGLVCAAVDHLDSASDKDLPGFHGIEKAGCRPGKEFRPGRPPPRLPAARAADRSSIVEAFAPATKQSCTWCRAGPRAGLPTCHLSALP